MMRGGFSPGGFEIKPPNEHIMESPKLQDSKSIPESSPRLGETSDLHDAGQKRIEDADKSASDFQKPLIDDNGNEISDKDGNLKPNITYSLFGIEYSTDDNGNVYCIDGEPLCNVTYVVDGHEYKTDDNGKIFAKDGKPLPDVTYTINNLRYTTDSNGLGHLDMIEAEQKRIIQDYLDGKLTFEDVKEILAQKYADIVNSNKTWSWAENIPGGEDFTAGQKEKIKASARDLDLVPDVTVRVIDGKRYADFREYSVFSCQIDESLWHDKDDNQFNDCNKQLQEAVENDPDLAAKFTDEQLAQIRNGNKPDGYTWHHSEETGKMQLVPFGIHNAINHDGGRSSGNWADAPRQ